MKTAVLLCFAVASGARAETRPRYRGSVEATLLGAPATLDPLLARTHAEITVASLVFDTLYRLGPDGQPWPQLAAAPPVIDDKRVHIALRKGVRFHDGSELKVGDVVASLERARQHARWLLASVHAVKAADDGIDLVLTAPTPELAALLALPQLAITKTGKPPGDRPIGSGPYAIDALDRVHHRLQLVAFEDHFAGRPYIDALALTWYDTPDGEARRFETGKAQVSARGAAAFANGQPAFRTAEIESPLALLVYVGFGRAHPEITADVAFRRALDLALARGGLTSITSGERVVPTRSPVPGSVLDVAGKTGDLAAARAQLAMAVKHAPKLTATKLEVIVEDTRPDDRAIAERVAYALDKLGVQAVITAVGAGVLRDRVAKGQCDLWIGQHALPVGLQSIWWAVAFADAGDAMPADPAQAFASRLPIVPLMFRTVRIWHPTNVRGLAFDSSARPSYADVFMFGAPTPNKGQKP